MAPSPAAGAGGSWSTSPGQLPPAGHYAGYLRGLALALNGVPVAICGKCRAWRKRWDKTREGR